MTPTPRQRTGLASAWSETHRGVVGSQRPTPPDPPGKAEAAEARAAPAAATRRNWKYLSARLPADVHKTLRRLSVEKDISLQDMVVEALRVYVQELTDAAVEHPEADAGRRDGDPDRRNRPFRRT